MHRINKPLAVPELNIEPPISGKIILSDDMQQTLALLTAMGSSKRIVLKASASGNLLVGEPVIEDVIVLTGSGSPSVIQGDDIPCSSVLIMAHPDNVDVTWIRPYAAVDATHRWALNTGDVVSFAVDNVNRIHALFDTAAEKIIIAYTR